MPRRVHFKSRYARWAPPRLARWCLPTVAVCLLSACVGTDSSAPGAELDPAAAILAEHIHQRACADPQPSDRPWHIKHLYDCKTRSLFIPYQLWTGAHWDGDKHAPCMHRADALFKVNDVSKTTIKGPYDYQNPVTGDVQLVWHRAKVDGSKMQYFSCHKEGIGRVYDSRGPRYYKVGRCKFPAGHAWRIGHKRSCTSTSIQITQVNLNADGTLADIHFKWWYGSTLDHIYRYAPNIGMTNAWPQ